MYMSHICVYAHMYIFISGFWPQERYRYDGFGSRTLYHRAEMELTLKDVAVPTLAPCRDLSLESLCTRHIQCTNSRSIPQTTRTYAKKRLGPIIGLHSFDLLGGSWDLVTTSDWACNPT